MTELPNLATPQQNNRGVFRERGSVPGSTRRSGIAARSSHAKARQARGQNGTMQSDGKEPRLISRALRPGRLHQATFEPLRTIPAIARTAQNNSCNRANRSEQFLQSRRYQSHPTDAWLLEPSGLGTPQARDITELWYSYATAQNSQKHKSCLLWKS
jgi:hypothetical protein